MKLLYIQVFSRKQEVVGIHLYGCIAHLLLQYFKRENEATLYFKFLADRKKLMVSIYMDDLLVIGNNTDLL